MNKKVAFVGTYPPEECGIATFTKDVLCAAENSGWQTYVCPVTEKFDIDFADPRVVFRIEKEKLSDYRYAISKMEAHNIGVLCIQHEYGIFGGDHGRHIIEMAKFATMPVIVTLHTVLPHPSVKERTIIKALEKYVSSFVVMCDKAIEILRNSYGISPKKVFVIPHGAPDIPFNDYGRSKAQMGLYDKKVLSTFGLIGPSKGIEDVISALPSVVKKVPDVIYLILGETHPAIKKKQGEEYRESLMRLVTKLRLENNVQFVNKYFSLEELTQYLQCTDVYITPYYANPYQITSGTLAYAVALGKAVISTPYLYAEELLSNGRGILYPFREIKTLSSNIEKLLTDKELFEKTRKLAYKYGRTMTWENVGVQYGHLFTQCILSKK